MGRQANKRPWVSNSVSVPRELRLAFGKEGCDESGIFALMNDGGMGLHWVAGRKE